jgi:hypothetical protein
VHGVQTKPAFGRIVNSSPDGACLAAAVLNQDPPLITLPLSNARNVCLVPCLGVLLRLVLLDCPVSAMLCENVAHKNIRRLVLTSNSQLSERPPEVLHGACTGAGA